MSARTAEARSVSDGWLYGVKTLLEHRGRAANHFLIRMSEPLPERDDVRADVDALHETLGLQPVDEVRNTIFPADNAEDLPDPNQLSADYIGHYDFLRNLGSLHGTYFGRIVHHPGSNTASNQLVQTITKLNAAKNGARWRATYEVNIYSDEDDWKIKRGFPCMSHLAFQLDGDQLDCLATYRSHDMINKAYGNYLGLAELQRYVATRCEFASGELTVLAGHAFIELTRPQRAQLTAVVDAHT